MKTSKYFLTRLLKSGVLEVDQVVDAIIDAIVIEKNNSEYTFTEAETFDLEGVDFVYGRLARYSPSGETKVVDPKDHTESVAEVQNLLIGSSPFIYIPSEAIVAYQQIWGRLEKAQFARAFARLITEKYRNFFVDCELEPISDLEGFVRRLIQLDSIVEIRATVKPPNPLFGDLWKSLRDYLRARNATKILVEESGQAAAGLKTELPRLVKSLQPSQATSDEEESETEDPTIVERSAQDTNSVDQDSLSTVALSDAAVLMALDGYGRARIRGRKKNKQSEIRSEDAQLSFRFASDPEPKALAKEVGSLARRINSSRKLTHGK